MKKSDLFQEGFGSYGDMVLILNDSSKVEMKSLPLFREKQKFIEDNINKRTQIPNLKEAEGFATKSNQDNYKNLLFL